MDAQQVKDYLALLPDDTIALYSSLAEAQKDKNIFMALEVLKDFYREVDLTPRIVALQMLFILESENEEFGRLKRHGIQSMSTKDTSVTFNRDDALAPSVVSILGEPLTKSKGRTGRLI